MIILGDRFKPSSKIIRIGIHIQVAWESGNFLAMGKDSEYALV